MLWASTGTKNPHYSDVLYIEELIGPETVNTVPPDTLSAFRDHGRPRASLEEDVSGAMDVLADLEKSGISLKQVTDDLLADGQVDPRGLGDEEHGHPLVEQDAVVVEVGPHAGAQGGRLFGDAQALERHERAWALRARIPDLRAAHDAKLFPRP